MAAEIVDVILITIGITLFYTLLSRVFIKPSEVRAIKKETEEFKKKSVQARKENDMEKFKEYQLESLKAGQKLFKKNLKPMMITLVIFFIAFGWIAAQYSGFCVQVVDQSGISADPACMAIEGGSDSFEYQGTSHTFGLVREGAEISGISVDGETHSNLGVLDIDGRIFGIAINEPSFLNIVYPFHENKVTFNWLLAKSPFVIPFIGEYLNWFWMYFIIALPASMLFRKMVGLE